jgi:aminodeoxyfutalosine synthase
VTVTFEAQMTRISAGERLSPEEVTTLASAPDILTLGMLADAAKRRLHGTRTTFLRVAVCPFDQPLTDVVLPAAREIRLTGTPDSLEVAVAAVETARSVAGDRAVCAFSWADVERLAAGGGAAGVLEALRRAGLDALAELPLDATPDLRAAVGLLKSAGFERLRLSVTRAAAAERTALLLRAGELQDEVGVVASLDPLPTSLNAFRPTTGYEDVKMVAIARLAAPSIPTIQVDWSRYGPKLAQVALTFGADDLHGVSASDDAPEGRRRAPLEDIRRNIEAAGSQPVERDGRFAPIS